MALIQALGRNQMTAYLTMMTVRLTELRRVLKPNGSIYLHCDTTASHLLRLVMDTIFGTDLFRAHITWKRYGSHNDTTTFGNVCDHILFYGNTRVRDAVREPLDADYIRKAYRNEDARGKYTTAPLHTGGLSGGGYEYEFHGHTRIWRYPEHRMYELEEDDRIHLPKSNGGMPRRKVYLHESKGKPLSNLWDDIPALTGAHAERLGYDTQKPELLLERIIQASSDSEDIVLDPFCGCGTAMAAAHKLNRRWAGIDITHLAIGLVEDRLRAIGADPRVVGAPQDLASARDLALRDRFQFETWAVTRLEGFRPNEKQVGDEGIDGRMRFIKREPETGKHKTEYGLAVAQVKSGKLGASDVRDFVGALKHAEADLGVLIALDLPGLQSTVQSLAAREGSVTIGGREYPRVQIWPITNHFDARLPQLPYPLGRESRRLL